MADYQEGQHLNGSDGKKYVVMGGVPRQVLATDPKVGLDLTGKTLGNQRDGIAVQKDTATLPSDIAKSKSEAEISASNATLLRQKVEEQNVAKRLDGMGPTNELHGDAYLKRFVPPAQWETVKAYARGDLGSKAGGMSASMLPIIQHAMNYDPSASGTNFPARAKMQADLAGSQPNTAGGSLRAMERMLLHGREVLRGGAALNNYGPGILGSAANAVRTAYDRSADNPTLAHYEALVRNYSPEAQKAIAQTSGGVEERADRAHGFNGSMSQASRAGALQADARQALDAMGAVNEQYKRLMGRDIVDALSPDAKKAYDEIMAGGFAKDGKPMYPADGNSEGPGPAVETATGSTASKQYTPETAAGLDHLAKAGVGPDVANAYLKTRPDGAGHVVNPDSWKASADFAASYKKGTGNDYPGSFHPVITQPMTMAQEGVKTLGLNGAVGTALTNAVNTASGGIPLMMAGEDAQLGLEATNNANPKSAFLGKTAGFVAGAYGLGKVGKAVGILKDAAKAAPIIDGAIEAVPGRLSQMGSYIRAASPDIVMGGSNGVAENPDHPIAGALMGIGGVAAGNVIGHTVIAPGLRALAGTKPGQAVASAAVRAAQGFTDARAGGAAIAPSTKAAILQAAAGGGDGFAPVPKLGKADQILRNSAAFQPDNLPGVRAQLQSASDVGFPMMLADTHQSIEGLAGSAFRHGDNFATQATRALDSRFNERTQRALDAINQHLAPAGDIVAAVNANRVAAQAAGKPFYDAALEMPPVNDPRLAQLLETPGGIAAAKAGYTHALHNDVSPGELTMRIDPATGQPVYDTALNPRTVQNIKIGLDQNVEGYRDPLTRILDLSPDTAAGALNTLRHNVTARAGELYPPMAAGNKAYADVIGHGTAMDQGYALADKMGRMNPDRLGGIVDGVKPDHIPAFQSGVASRFADNATNMGRGDPYGGVNGITGTLGSRERLPMIFGQDAADNLGTISNMESQATRTRDSITGNSKTQQRSVADKLFQAGANVSPLVLGAVDMALGGHGLTGVGLGAGLAAVRHAATLQQGRMTSAVADELGPQLINPNPLENLAAINALLKQNAARQAYERQFGQAGGAIGGTLGGAGAFGAGQ